MTSADLVAVGNSLANSAAALATASSAIVTLVAQLKANGGLIDQTTLDTVVTQLQASQNSIDASVTTLKNLAPTS